MVPKVLTRTRPMGQSHAPSEKVLIEIATYLIPTFTAACM